MRTWTVLALIVALSLSAMHTRALATDAQWGCTTFLENVQVVSEAAGVWTAGASAAVAYTQEIAELGGAFGTVVSPAVTNVVAALPNKTFLSVPSDSSRSLFGFPLVIDSGCAYLGGSLSSPELTRAPFGALGAIVDLGDYLDVAKARKWRTDFGIRIAQSGPGFVGAGYYQSHGIAANSLPLIEVSNAASAENTANQLIVSGATVLYVADVASMLEANAFTVSILSRLQSVATTRQVPLVVRALSAAAVNASVEAGVQIFSDTPLETLPAPLLARMNGRYILSGLAQHDGAGVAGLTALVAAGAIPIYSSGSLSNPRNGVAAPTVYSREMTFLRQALGDNTNRVLTAATSAPAALWATFPNLFGNVTGTLGAIATGRAASFGLFDFNPVQNLTTLETAQFAIASGFESGCFARDKRVGACAECYYDNPPVVGAAEIADPKVEVIVALVVPSAFIGLILILVTVGFLYYLFMNGDLKEAPLFHTVTPSETYIDEETLAKRNLYRHPAKNVKELFMLR